MNGPGKMSKKWADLSASGKGKPGPGGPRIKAVWGALLHLSCSEPRRTPSNKAMEMQNTNNSCCQLPELSREARKEPPGECGRKEPSEEAWNATSSE